MKPDPRDSAGPCTVGRVFRQMDEQLRAGGQDDAESVAEMAIAHLLEVRPLDIHLRARDAWPADKTEALADMTGRLLRQEPIQYVTGRAEFIGRSFIVDRRALIPRPETEQLVTAVLSDSALADTPSPRIADVGTGSGVIAVSLALAHPEACVAAFDLSREALTLARENARRFGVERRIAWRGGDLLEGVPAGMFDAIAANLPYVPTAELEQLEPRIRGFEPLAALDGGADGLKVIVRLLPHARRALRPGGLILLEIGDRQGPAIERALEAHGFLQIRVQSDPAGHDRIARAVTPGASIVRIAKCSVSA